MNLQRSAGQHMCKMNKTYWLSPKFDPTLRCGATVQRQMDSSWPAKDSEDFKRMAINKSVPRTQDLTQSEQRQMKTLIERRDNMEPLQDRSTFCLESRC